MMKLPLTTENLNKIKANIKSHIETYQVNAIMVSQIGWMPGGRQYVESFYWPIAEALDIFIKDGAIRKEQETLTIVKPEYFQIQFDPLNLPIQFSIDKRIEVDLLIMTALYADIYDVENRMRYFLEERLIQKYGQDFLPHLIRSVRESIEREKNNTRWHIPETRTRELNFTNFGDLIKIVSMQDFLPANNIRQALLEKLEYLSEARTRVGHNNLLPDEDNQKIKDYAAQVRRLIKQL